MAFLAQPHSFLAEAGLIQCAAFSTKAGFNMLVKRDSSRARPNAICQSERCMMLGNAFAKSNACIEYARKVPLTLLALTTLARPQSPQPPVVQSTHLRRACCAIHMRWAMCGIMSLNAGNLHTSVGRSGHCFGLMVPCSRSCGTEIRKAVCHCLAAILTLAEDSSMDMSSYANVSAACLLHRNSGNIACSNTVLCRTCTALHAAAIEHAA